MATKYYRDKDGNYLGGFDGATGKTPLAGILVAEPPLNAAAIWNGSSWVEPVKTDDQKVIDELTKNGFTLEQRVAALEKKIMENDSTKADEIQAVKDDVLKI